MYQKIKHNKFSTTVKVIQQRHTNSGTTNQSVKGKRANQKPKDKTGN
jgi:hypothetical protein